jgi:hypothetical protein
MRGMAMIGRQLGVCALLSVGMLLIISCGSQGAVGTPQSSATTAAAAVATSPTPPPFQQIVLNGQGSQVTDQFELPQGNFKMTWLMRAVTTCCPNIIVSLVGQDKSNLIATQDLTGSTLINSGGGFFRMQVESDGTAWTLTIDKL